MTNPTQTPENATPYFPPAPAGIWQQWDRQTNEPESAFIELSNLYLRIERGETALTITTANSLRVLAGVAYGRDKNQVMLDYWQREFEKLDKWFEI